ncbi:putative zinc finger protein [Eutypa lata UCREL1]|uniref:Putative zinc finger protein n=1 Tax=Eutypa lata (strain UCR-EL1) TaxID=1287681 RepID=M7SSK4_EUTLA|nr:putative zinc finger protein [Eutypa lata UCREL1]
MTWTCGTCHRDFVSVRAREQHMDALGHSQPTHECDTCSKYFGNRAAVVQHMNASNHWMYDCPLCDETWPSKDKVDKHVIEYHHHCKDCDRTFGDYNRIKMHLNSRTHRRSEMGCPFCKRAFVSATGLSHHLESGSCPKAPSLDRDMVYKLVRSKDPNGIVSKKLIGWHGSSKYEATGQAWNGSAWECYFCHRDFNTKTGLDQHLNSPIHQQNLYHCPNRMDCGKDFKSLAGVMNHLESESCGFTRFEKVQTGFRGVVGGDRLIGFH